MEAFCPYFEIHLANAAKTKEETSGVINRFSFLCHEHKLSMEGTCTITPQECALSTVCNMLCKYCTYCSISILKCYNEEIKMKC